MAENESSEKNITYSELKCLLTQQNNPILFAVAVPFGSEVLVPGEFQISSISERDYNSFSFRFEGYGDRKAIDLTVQQLDDLGERVVAVRDIRLFNEAYIDEEGVIRIKYGNPGGQSKWGRNLFSIPHKKQWLPLSIEKSAAKGSCFEQPLQRNPYYNSKAEEEARRRIATNKLKNGGKRSTRKAKKSTRKTRKH